MNTEPEEGRIEDFRGDCAAVAELMPRSWAENRQTPLLYTTEFLASAFTYPGTPRSLSQAYYSGDRPMAFTAGFPRKVAFGGAPLRLVLHSFVTAAPELKGKGFGRAVWVRATQQSRSAGYDGTVNFCVEGDVMNSVILKWSAASGFETRRVFSISFLSAIVRPHLAEENDPVAVDVDAFLAAAAPIPVTTHFARLWTREEAEWQTQRRLGALSVTHHAAGRSGVLSGYVMEAADASKTRCGIVDDVLWGTLLPDEQLMLVRKLMARASTAGVKLLTVPSLGYAPLEPFLASGFRRSRRVLHTFLTFWNRVVPERLTSLYLDVL